jgi:signal transduction histidine kinase/CheY-like chemotaxis protein
VVKRYRRWPLLAAFGAAAGVLVVSSAVMLASMRSDAIQKASAQLEAIGALKTSAIEEWIGDRVLAAHFACSYPAVITAARQASAGRVDPALRAHVREVLAHFADRSGYPLAGLLDGSGRPIALAGSGAAAATLPDRWFLEAAIADPRSAAVRLDVKADGRAALDVAVLERSQAGTLSFCVVSADATAIVEDALERWPIPSESGSAALMRADGDSAVVFGPRRERPPEGFIRVPLARRDRAVVRAVSGERGLIEGLNRDGVPILIRARPIPDTAWLLRTRLDREEVMAPLGRPTMAIAGLAAAFLLVGGALLFRWWRDEGRRAAAEAELRRSRERLELAIAGTQAIWDWDLVEGRLRIEGDLARQLELPAEGLSGDLPTIVAGFVHPDDRPQEVAAIQAHLQGASRLYESEHRSLGHAGATWIRMRGKVVGRDSEGRPVRMAGVAADVTERRRLQGQLDLSQRMAGLGRLAAGVAHEINNPLSSVIGNLCFLAEETSGGSAELRDAIAEARDGARRVAEVVRGLRSFTRPGPAQRGAVDVRQELDAALRLAHHELRHRAVVEVRHGELPPVVAEAHELAQVFLNLLVNAAQAIPEGHAEEHRVEVETRTDAKGWAVISFRDTGVGIPPEVLDRIFEPFFTTKPLGIGTGLGLAISHGIVTEAGGRMEVESRVGHGSTFRVVLPPAADARAPAGPAAVADAAAAPRALPVEERARLARVLVIDDEPLVARAVVRALGDGYDVALCTSARDALGRFEEGERFDAVLCDLMMPQMNGMELHARAGRIDPGIAARFVFVTGGAFTEAAAEFLRTTRNAWIEKPFEPQAVREAVDRVVGR